MALVSSNAQLIFILLLMRIASVMLNPQQPHLRWQWQCCHWLLLNYSLHKETKHSSTRNCSSSSEYLSLLPKTKPLTYKMWLLHSKTNSQCYIPPHSEVIALHLWKSLRSFSCYYSNTACPLGHLTVHRLQYVNSGVSLRPPSVGKCTGLVEPHTLNRLCLRLTQTMQCSCSISGLEASRWTCDCVTIVWSNLQEVQLCDKI